MDILFIVVIFALLFIPSFLMMRRQRRQQSEVASMQASLQPGHAVVTSAGLHGTIASLTDTTVDVELAPGVVVTMEKIAIMRSADPNNQPSPVMGEGVGEVPEGPSSYWDNHPDYNEQAPEQVEHPENRGDDNDRRDNPGNDHPENLR